MAGSLRNIAKTLIPRGWLMLLRNLRSMTETHYGLDLYGAARRLDAAETALQGLLRLNYGSIARDQDQVAIFRRHELKVYSQYGEDGLLLYLFSKVGATDHGFVEFGMGDGRECNTANLSINFGWSGLLMDCSPENVAAARDYYESKPGIKPSQIRIAQCLVTAENINGVLRQNDVQGEIDLLSIDIDGNDYWVWKAITVIQPRVVVAEYNASLGASRSVTVQYDPVFDRYRKHASGWYHGASLAALRKLAAKGIYACGL